MYLNLSRLYSSTLSKLTVTLAVVILVERINAQLPNANFTASTTSGCSPLVVQFTDLSTGNPFSWNWDFGNGQLSTLQNPLVTFYNAGTYTVRLIVKNASGVDEEVKTNYITILPTPTASFTSNQTIACAPGTIQFTDQSVCPPAAGSIVSWSWTFGDGGTSSQKNPSYTYASPGYYTVALTVTSSSGCQNTVSIGRYIKIVNGVNTDFTWSEPSSCAAPFPVTFHDQSEGPGTLSYSWNFGNGGTSTLQQPTTVYNSAGTYSVTLQVNSSMGCNGSVTKNVPVLGRTTDFIAPVSACMGQSITFQNNSSPAPVSSSWNFGDGTTSSQINPQKTYLSIGTFSVRLINNYGNCIDSTTKNISITNQPPVNFTATDSGSCQAPFTVHFTDQSPAAAAWIWDFGDGTTSNQQNPSHTYTAAGNYTVSLTITLAGGCTNTKTKQQFIRIAPTTVEIANTPAGGCVPFSFSPVALVHSVDGITGYTWDMGEPGGIYNTQFPTHVYNSVGVYNITLTVTTQNGCTASVVATNGVMTGTHPTANFTFTPNNVCASIDIQFTDLSDTTAGYIVTRRWDFGDGAFSFQQNPLHVYEDTGRMSAKLVISNNGCKDSLSKPITVLPPVAKFGYHVNCNNRTQVTFIDSSLTNPAYGPITYEWRMGDSANTVFFGPTPPTFTYPSLGIYTATLTVTNGSCSYQTTRRVILMNETPNFTIDKNPVCKSETFTLTALVSDTLLIKGYTWMVGGTTLRDSSRIARSSLPAYGNYPVTLTTKDINGCSNSHTIQNFIHVGGPVPNFTTSGPGGCVNTTINFTDHSTPPNTVTSWTWNYGDGTQQTYSSPPFSHTYLQTGSYSVSLMIKDTANCADTLTRVNIVLITHPVAAFRADTFYCPMAPLQFVDTSTGNGLSYLWNFGDGGISTSQNPTHAYPNGNNFYTVRLRITDTVGCRDSITKTNYIHIRTPQSAFTMQDSTGICLPTVTNFTFGGQFYQSYYWTFGDGTRTTSQNPQHFYNSYGVYTPKLFLIGPGGCVDSSQRTVTIYDPQISTQVNDGPNTGCHTVTSNFNIVTPPGFRFKFFYGDGQEDSTQQTTLTHTYAWPGNYNPYVILYDNYGCDAGVYGNPIHVYGALPIFSENKKEFCDSGKVFFLNHSLTNDPIISTVWDFGDGNTSSEIEPSHIFSPPKSYIITLTLTTQQQCVSSSKDTVRIYPTPDLRITGKDTLCLNTVERFSGALVLPDSTIKWQWTFGNGATGATQSCLASYTSTGNYNIHLIATNKLGCADTSDHPVFVVPLPTVSATSNPFQIISGANTILNMNYTGPIISYNWLPTQSLSCNTCPAPIANPQFTTKYSVDVVDRFGCASRGFATVKVLCNGQNFFIPNSFSPNGDGINDVFYLRGTGLFRVKSLRIFDRWGEMVFEKTEVPVNDPSFGWNGTYKGRKASAGVYVYQIEIICSNGELMTYSGNIALIL